MTYLSAAAVTYAPTTYNFSQVSNNERSPYGWRDDHCDNAKPGDQCCDPSLFDGKMVIDGRSFFLVELLDYFSPYDVGVVDKMEYYAIEDVNGNGQIDKEDNAVLIENQRNKFCFPEEIDQNGVTIKEIITPLGSKVRMGYWQIPATYDSYFFLPDRSRDRSYRNPHFTAYPDNNNRGSLISGFSVMENLVSESLDGSQKTVFIGFDFDYMMPSSTAEVNMKVTAHFKTIGERELVEEIQFNNNDIHDGAIQIDIPWAYRGGFLSLDFAVWTQESIDIELKPPLFVEQSLGELVCGKASLLDYFSCRSLMFIYDILQNQIPANLKAAA